MSGELFRGLDPKNMDSIHRALVKISASDIAEHSASLVNKLSEYSEKSHIGYDTKSLIFKTLNEVLRAIPDGSVWCGVTHMGNKDPWESKENFDFNSFQDASFEYVKQERIKMYRVFITDKDHLLGLEEQIEEILDAGIKCRYILAEDPQKAREEYEDVSLIWHNGVENSVQLEEKDRVAVPIEGADDLSLYPYFWLKFNSQNMILTDVKINRFTAVEKYAFLGYAKSFNNAWKKGTEFTR